MQVNKIRDLAERVGWTFIQAEIALGALDWLTKGINLALWHQLEVSAGAAVAATVKVLLAQRLGSSGDGSAIPGGVTKAVPDA